MTMNKHLTPIKTRKDELQIVVDVPKIKTLSMTKALKETGFSRYFHGKDSKNKPVIVVGVISQRRAIDLKKICSNLGLEIKGINNPPESLKQKENEPILRKI